MSRGDGALRHRGALDSATARVPGPVRTCVGCRTRAPQAALLRVVAVGGVLVPDPARRLPGRGASVHRDLRCVDLAERRRAFSRALRLAGTPDVAPVREHVAAQHGPHDEHDPHHSHGPHHPVDQHEAVQQDPDDNARREQAEP